MSLAYSDKELAIREELANSMDIHPDATSHFRTYPSIRDYYEGNRKDKKKGSRAPIDWTTPLIGLFPYINSNINHGAGVGAIFAVESEVLKIAKVIEDQGLQNYHNFS